ncbi:MAG: trypsin-like peptidase domain-containing protein [Anaerolineae bacterium]|nr:trypsin-like peptidase domain-containing protein [Anaerolineae bacterium]
MSVENIYKGIEAIQQGNISEGSRFLRIALRDDTIRGQMRATALLWLAETTDNHQSKLNYYQEALTADPNNMDVQVRLDRLMAVNLPPTPPLNIPPQPEAMPIRPTYAPITPPPQPEPEPIPTPITPPSFTPTPPKPATRANALYRTVGIRGVRNGRGTGFFINKEGVIVTSRYVVSGEQSVRVQLDDNQELDAQVIRAYPEYDIVFLETGLTIQHLLQPVNTAHLPENSALVAHSHYGKSVTGKRRATKNELKPFWIPTTIEKLPDAGGLPIFNDANMLVGMLTKNTSRTTAYCFGIHIHHIFLLWERTQSELNTPNTVYCGRCGNRSNAPMLKGGFYCETCGSVLPYAEDQRRYPTPDMAWRYGENNTEACEYCQSRVGFYKDACLRCGKTRKKVTKK